MYVYNLVTPFILNTHYMILPKTVAGKTSTEAVKKAQIYDNPASRLYFGMEKYYSRHESITCSIMSVE
ncbi:hypothetical protein J1TS3_04140 [Siminovitchia fordii]|uniref:Uncharacterized protein n=1 Tax=Siminovitchia fordii TaxID=254759 RepID=A0ABQ4K2R4_9BACI|nr:hypothetical protein J1TS3_04140 [Siminovitchia fordii]